MANLGKMANRQLAGDMKAWRKKYGDPYAQKVGATGTIPSGGGASIPGGGGGGGNRVTVPGAGGPPMTGGGLTPDLNSPYYDRPNRRPPQIGGGGQGPGGGQGGFSGSQLSSALNFNGYPGYAGAGGSGDIYGLATGGTINQYNTAANRLRERIDSATAGNIASVRGRNLSRGFGASGLNDAGIAREKVGGLNAYAQGLSDLSNQFEDRRLQGLNIALGAKGLDTQNMQFADSQLFNLLNSREGRENQLLMQNKQNLFQGGQNQNDRDMQQLLEQLQQQNENYRNSLNAGLNSLPQYSPYNLSGSINGSIGGGYLGYNNNYFNGPTVGMSR